MKSGTWISPAVAACGVLLVVMAVPSAGLAQQDLRRPLLPGLLKEHSHRPVDLESRPILSRYPVALMRPRRLLVAPDGAVYVADWAAGTVLRIDASGQTTTVIDKLDEPAGLARDALGNLYVAAHAGGVTGAGIVVRIKPTGEDQVFARGLTGPTGLALDAQGNLYVAQFPNNTIVRVGRDGRVSPFAHDIPTPAALVLDAAGLLYTISSTEGTLFRVSPLGQATALCRGLAVPSDLALDAHGHLIVANYAGTELIYVDATGRTKTFATVPKGTIGIGFDAAGNLLLLNWDYQYAMKVITHLTVPCPHCGKEIPVHLRLKHPPPKPATPTGPVI